MGIDRTKHYTQLMDDHFELHELADFDSKWEDDPTTGEAPDELEDAPVVKDITPADVHVPAPDSPKKKRKREEDDTDFKIMKVDTERMLVGGWASVIEEPDGEPLVDRQGDVILEDDLLAAAHHFMSKSGELGYNHVLKTGIGRIVESVVFTRDVKKALGLPASFPTGWYIVAKVTDPDVWSQVKAGQLTSFSIGGSGKRVPMA